MKHYLRFDATGKLVGEHKFTGGFPEGCDPSCPDTTDETALWIRGQYPDTDSYFEYVCPCPSNVRFCKCAQTRTADSYLAGGTVLTPKPVITLVVDSLSVDQNTLDSPLVKVPGASITFQLAGADVPDGTVVEIRRASGGLLPDLAASFPFNLTFTTGVTEQVTLTAPLHGFTGGLWLAGDKYVNRQFLFVKAWA